MFRYCVVFMCHTKWWFITISSQKKTRQPNRTSSDSYSRCIPRILHKRTQICTLLSDGIYSLLLVLLCWYSCECPHTLDTVKKPLPLCSICDQYYLELVKWSAMPFLARQSPRSKQKIQFSCHIDIFRVLQTFRIKWHLIFFLFKLQFAMRLSSIWCCVKRCIDANIHWMSQHIVRS